VNPESIDLKSRIELPELMRLAQKPETISWEPFRDGVRIHRLYGDGVIGPWAALLFYEPGGRIPRHEHIGYEHIFILSGSQRDEAGELRAGTLVIHPPGTRHQVVSDAGCVALAIYEKPVQFL
jgi:anti-sigma factor ChrR (cupin superfamily)